MMNGWVGVTALTKLLQAEGKSKKMLYIQCHNAKAACYLNLVTFDTLHAVLW